MCKTTQVSTASALTAVINFRQDSRIYGTAANRMTSLHAGGGVFGGMEWCGRGRFAQVFWP